MIDIGTIVGDRMKWYSRQPLYYPYENTPPNPENAGNEMPRIEIDNDYILYCRSAITGRIWRIHVLVEAKYVLLCASRRVMVNGKLDWWDDGKACRAFTVGQAAAFFDSLAAFKNGKDNWTRKRLNGSRTLKYSDEQIRSALQLTNGHIKQAAEIVGCTDSNISRRVKLNPELMEVAA